MARRAPRASGRKVDIALNAVGARVGKQRMPVGF